MTAPAPAAICPDCLYTDANGWDEYNTGRPLPHPAPLNRLDGFLIGHGPDLEPSYSWQPCDGCGSTLGGDRYAVTIVKAPDRRAWTDCPACECRPRALCDCDCHPTR